MKRRFGFFLLTFTLGLMALPAFAVTGVVWFQRAPGAGTWYAAPSGTRVKLCYDNGTPEAASGKGECYWTTTSGQYWSLNPPTGRNYWAFAASSTSDWGSDTAASPLRVGGTSGLLLTLRTFSDVVNIDALPRPHAPIAGYPSNGAKHVPLSFTLRWSNGLDPDRSSPGWPVTYDLYANGNGAQERLILSNLPCNADVSGYCTYPITNLVPGVYYYWRIEAKLNAQLGSPGNPYFTTSSARFAFTTHDTTYSFGTSGGYFVGADNCGGSSVSAKSVSVGGCQTIKIDDLNGGTLDSGDQVYLRVYGGPWNLVAAYGGGGPLLATSQWGGLYETFTITKVSGWGALQDGDELTLQASNGQYCSAEGGGGGAVSCNRNEADVWETFTLGIMP